MQVTKHGTWPIPSTYYFDHEAWRAGQLQYMNAGHAGRFMYLINIEHVKTKRDAVPTGTVFYYWNAGRAGRFLYLVNIENGQLKNRVRFPLGRSYSVWETRVTLAGFHT